VPYRDLPDSLKAEYDRIGREREEASRKADRQARWELVRVCAEMLGCTVAGVFVASIGFAVTDHDYGMIFMYGGMVINYAGIATSLWLAYQRGQDRGDW
jgi:hypothetical protein